MRTGHKRGLAAILVLALYTFFKNKTQKKKRKTSTSLLLEQGFDQADVPLRKLKRAEAVLSRRVGNVVVVLERSTSSRDYEAVFRTCECLGVQNVWILEHPPPSSLIGLKTTQLENVALPCAGQGIFKRSRRYLSTQKFRSVESFLQTAEEQELDIWLVHNMPFKDVPFSSYYDFKEESIESVKHMKGSIPKRLALVFSADGNGFAPGVLNAASKNIKYDSNASSVQHLNVSMCAALVILRVLNLKGLRDETSDFASGDLSPTDKAELRKKWYSLLAKSEGQQHYFDILLKKPVKPFRDLRHPEEFRQCRVPPKIRKRTEKLAKEAREAT